MKGIDISKYQQGIDFTKTDAKVVFIKASEGLTYKNPLLELHYNQAKKAGLKVGFYHFQRTNNPIDEAKFFLDTIKGLESDCKYVIDQETDKLMPSYRIKAFADYLKSVGKEPMLYTGYSFYKTLDSTIKDIPLWVASYSKVKPPITSIGWQYTDCGSVGGIKVDMNEFEDSIFLNKVVSKVAKIDYCLQWQMWYNKLVKPKIKLKEDGVWGNLTFTAFNRVESLMKGGK